MKRFKFDQKAVKNRNDLVREAHFQFEQKRISRRDFLRFTAALGGGAMAMSLLPPMELQSLRRENMKIAQDMAPQRGGTLYNALGIDTETHWDDPATLSLVFPSNNFRQVCDYLVTLDYTLTLQPSLATSWTPSEDGLTWTVKLREGVKFNHGKTFGADDVVFTFSRLIDPATSSGWAGAANYVTGVEKIDDNTVAFHTSRVAADFIYTLFLYHAAILPADWPGDFITNPWGTGPFTLDAYTPGELIRFKARTDYWQTGADGKSLPYLDVVEFDKYADEAARFSAEQEGTLMMAAADTTLKSQYDQLTDFNFVAVQTANLDDIIMHFNEEPWTNPDVVKAMKLGMNRQAWVDTRFAGFAIPGNDQPIAPGLYPLAPADMDVTSPYDPEQAKALLAKAGYPDGLNITATYIAPTSPKDYTDTFAQFLVGAYEAAGIHITLAPDPHYWDTWLDDWGPMTIGLSNWAQKNTASEMFNLAYYSKGIWNESHWVNAEFDTLLEKFDSTLDQAERTTQLAKLTDLIATEGNVVIPGWRQDAAVIQKAVHYHLHPQAFVWMGDAWLESSS